MALKGSMNLLRILEDFKLDRYAMIFRSKICKFHKMRV